MFFLFCKRKHHVEILEKAEKAKSRSDALEYASAFCSTFEIDFRQAIGIEHTGKCQPLRKVQWKDSTSLVHITWAE